MTEAEKMKITAIAPWFGSKRTMADTIIEELGPHRSYWEPFCGSCAVLMAKPPAAQETVNDLHSDLVNLAMVLSSDHAAPLYERLQRILYDETLFATVKENLTVEFSPPLNPWSVEAVHVERAIQYMALAWMGRNGTSGTRRINYQMAIRWTPGGGAGPTRWRNAVESIPAWHDRLRIVCILHRDAFDVLEKIEDTNGTAIYVDPPYILSSRAKGAAQYQYEFDAADHERLSKALRRFERARVVLSYYDAPELKEFYPGWTIRSCYRNKNLHVQNQRGATAIVAPEVLLINGPSFATEANEASGAAGAEECGLFDQPTGQEGGCASHGG